MFIYPDSFTRTLLSRLLAPSSGSECHLLSFCYIKFRLERVPLSEHCYTS